MRGSVFVALHEVGNPGNLGTIIRTASAAGASGVILIGPAADPYDPAAVKASMGALFDVPVAQAAAGAEFPGSWAAGHGSGSRCWPRPLGGERTLLGGRVRSAAGRSCSAARDPKGLPASTRWTASTRPRASGCGSR